jgi:cell division protein FtsQ
MSPARTKVALAGVVAAAVVVFLTWLVAFSPVFGVRSVTVRGAKLVSKQRIEAAARIVHGTPIVRLDTGTVARRIEDALPVVADARVSTSFPSAVTITVTEQVPVGYVKHRHRYTLVDADGEQYKTVGKRPKKLPHFVVPSAADSRTSAAAVATVAAALPGKLRKHISSIQALNAHAITVLLRDHRVVHWGNAEHSSEKARVLRALLPHAQHLIDVSDPEKPFTR